jgi:hypothetical protein
MTITTEYPDCLAIFAKAEENRFGIRIKCVDYGTAMQLRTRMHRARAKARDESHFTDYDHLIVRVKEDDDSWWVYVEKLDALTQDIQPIGIQKPKAVPATVDLGTFKRRF